MKKIERGTIKKDEQTGLAKIKIKKDEQIELAHPGSSSPLVELLGGAGAKVPQGAARPGICNSTVCMCIVYVCLCVCNCVF